MHRTLANTLWSLLESLSFKLPIFARLYNKYYGYAVKKEIQLADITSSDKILHIGGGILPATSVVITQETNASVTCIDNIRKSLHLASQYIEEMGLSDSIKLDYGDGTTYPVENFTAIFISLGVHPREAVFNHVFRSVKSGTRVIFRETERNFQMFNREYLSDDFRIQYIRQPTFGVTYSIILTKK